MGIPLLDAPAVPAAHANLSGPANVANGRQTYHAPGRPWALRCAAWENRLSGSEQKFQLLA